MPWKSTIASPLVTSSDRKSRSNVCSTGWLCRWNLNVCWPYLFPVVYWVIFTGSCWLPRWSLKSIQTWKSSDYCPVAPPNMIFGYFMGPPHPELATSLFIVRIYDWDGDLRSLGDDSPNHHDLIWSSMNRCEWLFSFDQEGHLYRETLKVVKMQAENQKTLWKAVQGCKTPVVSTNIGSE
jgi:hypothetical protein